ncbi:MAG: gamma-glutamylcyclotransferase [Myxococcales bacterium]|nr:gamma-glutamylcyclotransferase [Myxococcales bacterium]
MWIFGYGSLVFRPGFTHLERQDAYVKGWVRRWWQASPDHRGTPEAPGRVVTLQQQAKGRCWGSAYHVSSNDVDEVLSALDYREKAGYVRHRCRITLPRRAAGSAWPEALLYVASPDNPNFIGAADPDEMAAHIARSHGPSGANADYLLDLAEALRTMGADDPDTFDLERRVRRLLGTST